MDPNRRYYGLNELDRLLETHLDFDEGVFIEAGANDGIAQSNTLYFERYRGWKGLLVEPHPRKFVECVMHRPDAYVECAALVPPEWSAPTVELVYANLMTVTCGAFGSPDADLAHVDRGRQFLGEEEPHRFLARARTISDLIDKYRMPEIDLLSLDLEGFEPAALRGIEFHRHAPRWILVEARHEAAVTAQLAPWYDAPRQLSHHDYLYRRLS